MDLGKVERKIACLIAIFDEQDRPTEALRVRCRDFESERLRLRAEIARLDARIAEMRAKACSPEDVAADLADLTGRLSGLSLPEQKALIQSGIGRITVSQSVDIASQHDRQDRANGVSGRTRRLTVDTQIRRSPTERRSVGPMGEKPDFGNRSPGVDDFGSPTWMNVRASSRSSCLRFQAP